MNQPSQHRILIRNMTLDDAKSLALHGNNLNIAKNQRDSFPFPYTEEDAEHWIYHINKTPEANYFAIATEKYVFGEIGFMIQPDVYCHSAEVSYWIGENYWGHGIATWALNHIIDLAFKEKKVKRLYANVIEYNHASQILLKKCGFKCDGVMRKHIFKMGRFYDEFVYSLLYADTLVT